jgi:hypothetical protein
MQTAGCPFKVIRTLSAQEATVFVLASDSWGKPRGERILYFQKGEWSTPSADPVSVTKRDDLWTVTVGREVYEIPDAVVFGG